MKKLILVLCCILLSNFSFSQTSNRLIIKFKENLNPKSSDVLNLQKFDNAILSTLNKNNNIQSIQLTGNKKKKDTYSLEFNSNKPIEELIEQYQNTGLFDYVEPNFIGHGHGVQITPNDNNYNRQWSHHNDGTFSLSNATSDADIDTDLAWDITQGDPNLIVAILDSGAKLNHPEFAGRIWINPNETSNGSDTDSNNYVDDINGWDFANNDNDPTDDHGHGTNVAGIALASGNNTIGYAGMNWNSKIMICKILDQNNNGYYSWWAEAIYYAVDNGASVINTSVGGNGASILLENAINYAYDNNVSVVVSTGNQNSTIQYPAKYANTFAIGSTNPDDTRSVPFFWDNTSGSNYGPELDFVAPGNYIYGLSHTSNTYYNTYWGGTSQAAPHVTGLISLLLSVKPNLSVSDIRLILEESSEDQVGNSDDTSGWDQYYGYGRINAYQALTHETLKINTVENTNNNLLVYPNPTTSGSHLKLSNLINGAHAITVYNIIGQQVYHTEHTAINNSITIGLPELNTGTYFVKINNTSKQGTTIKKLIVK
ncbi:S8/S53 family peptidase [Winogradskyella sp. PC D3.3]